MYGSQSEGSSIVGNSKPMKQIDCELKNVNCIFLACTIWMDVIGLHLLCWPGRSFPLVETLPRNRSHRIKMISSKTLVEIGGVINTIMIDVDLSATF